MNVSQPRFGFVRIPGVWKTSALPIGRNSVVHGAEGDTAKF